MFMNFSMKQTFTSFLNELPLFTSFMMKIVYLFTQMCGVDRICIECHFPEKSTYNYKNVPNFVIFLEKSFLITEYCPKGSLQDILEDDEFDLDNDFK